MFQTELMLLALLERFDRLFGPLEFLHDLVVARVSIPTFFFLSKTDLLPFGFLELHLLGAVSFQFPELLAHQLFFLALSLVPLLLHQCDVGGLLLDELGGVVLDGPIAVAEVVSALRH